MQAPKPTVPSKTVVDKFIEGGTKGLQAYNVAKGIGQMVQDISNAATMSSINSNLETLNKWRNGENTDVSIDDARKAFSALSPYQEDPRIKETLDLSEESLTESALESRLSLTSKPDNNLYPEEEKILEGYIKKLDGVDESRDKLRALSNEMSENVLAGKVSKEANQQLYESLMQQYDERNEETNNIFDNSYKVRNILDDLEIQKSRSKSIGRTLKIKYDIFRLNRLKDNVTPSAANAIELAVRESEVML